MPHPPKSPPPPGPFAASSLPGEACQCARVNDVRGPFFGEGGVWAPAQILSLGVCNIQILSAISRPRLFRAEGRQCTDFRPQRTCAQGNGVVGFFLAEGGQILSLRVYNLLTLSTISRQRLKTTDRHACVPRVPPGALVASNPACASVAPPPAPPPAPCETWARSSHQLMHLRCCIESLGHMPHSRNMFGGKWCAAMIHLCAVRV